MRLTLAVFVATGVLAWALCDRAHRHLSSAGHGLPAGHGRHRPGHGVHGGRGQGGREVARIAAADRDLSWVMLNNGGGSNAQLTIALKPRDGRPHRHPWPRSSPAFAPSSPRWWARRTTLNAQQDITVGGRRRAGPVPVHPLGRGPGRTQRLDAADARCAQGLAATEGRQFRPAVQRQRRDADHRPPGVGALRHHAGRHRRGHLQPDRPAPDRQTFTSSIPTAWCWRGRRIFRPRRTCSTRCT